MNIENTLSITLLEDSSVIAVTGIDGSRFLQGQLSCNLSRLNASQALRGALCNLKGRVVADMLLVASEERILLCSQQGMSTVILDTLEKYRVFFKTGLADQSAQFVRYGLVGAGATEALSALGLSAPNSDYACTLDTGVTVIRLPGSPIFEQPRFEVVLEKSVATNRIPETFETIGIEADEIRWRACDIRAGIARIRPGQTEQYTPQLLNYDVNGVIDFKKGCYTGQEVVARMFYRADAKKRLFYYQGTDALNVPGADIVDSVVTNGLTEMLLVMNRESAMSATGVRAFY